MAKLKALIWDCDGVLAETEKDGHRVAFNRVFEEEGLGVHWDVATYGEKLKIAGGKERMRTIVYAPDFTKDVGDRDAFIKKMHKRKTDLYMEMIEAGKLPARKGVQRLMREAHAKGIRIAIASTSNVRGVTLIAKHNLGEEIFGWIEHICAGDMVQKKKPAPDIYNMALERLGVAPEEALVVEDTGNGVKAGIAAGCKVLVTRSEYSKGKDFPDAMLAVDSLGEGEDAVTIDRLIEMFEAEEEKPVFDLKQWLVAPLKEAAVYSMKLGELADDHPELGRMCLNENPLPISEKVIEALATGGRQGNVYPGTSKELKARIGAMNGLEAQNVFLANGSSEIIDSMMRAFLNPGDEVLLPDPTFSLFKVRASVVGAKVVGIPFTEGDLDYSVDAYLNAVTERTKLIVVVVPNNPTGAFMSTDDLRKILELGIPTCIDEAYLEFHPDIPTQVELVKEYPNAFVSHTLSKAYGLAGLRFGYLLGRPEMVQIFQILAQPWNVSQQMLAAAAAALDDEEALARNVAYMKKWMDRYTEVLTKLGLKPIHPAGNFMLVDANMTGKESQAIFEAGLKAGVILKPVGAVHGKTGYFRLTPGSEADNAKAIAFFEEYFG